MIGALGSKRALFSGAWDCGTNMAYSLRDGIYLMIIKESFSSKDTEEIAKQIAKEAKPGSIICLDGDLGVGKTAFAKGFAKGLGIEEEILSPTFTIMQIYREGRLPLYHFDVYRIADPEEMDELGYEEFFFSEGVCLVEWAEQIAELIPKEALRIRIEKDAQRGFDYRRIKIQESKEG